MTDQPPVEGAIDLHSHAGPSPFPRRMNADGWARAAAEAGMAGVTVKEHFFPTVYGAQLVDSNLGDDYDVEVLTGIALNYCNGGFNPFAVQTAIDYGAEFVWAPTIDARNHGEQGDGVGQHDLFGDGEIREEYAAVTGLSPLDDDGELTEGAKLCIRKVVDNDLILGLGHISYEETLAMAEYAADRGHDQLLIDHPGFPTKFAIEEQQSLADLGAYLNYMWVSVASDMAWQTPQSIYESIRAVGVENAVLTTGTGQRGNPTSPEALGILGGWLMEEGLTAAEFRQMTRETPQRILGWD